MPVLKANMKIGIDASRYGHEQSTGVEWYSFKIINEIIEQNRNSDDEFFLYSREQINFRKELPRNFKNVVVHGKRLWTLRSLSEEMRKNPPDVLFVPSHTLPISLPSRTVITIHDVAFRHIKKAYSTFNYHHLNWSTKFAAKKASKIIVPSLATKQDLMKIYNCREEKIAVIHHGFSAPAEVDENIFESSEVLKYFGINPQMKYILFVGRLESKKNLVRLIEAFSGFRKKHEAYKLILAGKRGEGFKEILKKINQLDLMSDVIMPGYITEEEKAALYKNCRVFAFPSLYEGFGFPLLEAFYYKKPVLASKISASVEVCQDAAYFVDPYIVKEMAVGLERLVEDEKLAEDLVEKAGARLKKFDWGKAAEDTMRVIKNF